MPTIDQLAPATAASDTDALVASQSGIARKVTRAQLVAGLQPELALSSGALLGRISTGSGGPEQVSVGANLVLNNGTLSAAATPFQIAQLPAGVVPASGDLVPLAQSGTNVAVSYTQFAVGLGSISGIDASAMAVSVGGGSQTLSEFAAACLLQAGGDLTGPLSLAADPVSPLQAATKQYVDARTASALPIVGGTITGALGISGLLTGAAASFTGPVNASGALECGGAMTATGGLFTSSAVLGGNLTASGTLAVIGAAQLGAANVDGAVVATGVVSAAGGFVGSTLGLTGGITAGGALAVVGPLSVGGGTTIGGGMVVLPQHTVAALPTASGGALAYATNGRKPGEAAGAGSGVVVWGTGASQWLSILTGTPVQA